MVHKNMLFYWWLLQGEFEYVFDNVDLGKNILINPFLCEFECVFDNVEFEATEELENWVLLFAELSFFVNYSYYEKLGCV